MMRFVFILYIVILLSPNTNILGMTYSYDSRLSNKLIKINHDSQILNFSWNKHEEADYYFLQISKREDFSEILVARKVKQHSTNVNITSQILNNPGTYYWRVYVIKTNRKAILLKPSNFIVQESSKRKSLNKTRRSLFFSGSQGQTTEVTQQGSRVTHNQNSPITVGGFWGKAIGVNWNLSSSAYLSYFTSNKIEGVTSQEIATPLEFGANLYAGLKLASRYEVYFGWDFEKLNILNLDEVISNNANPRTKDQLLHYYTAGLTFFSQAFKKAFLIKASFSQSFLNQGEVNEVTGNRLQGMKYILFAQYQLTQKIGLQGFIKNHFLKDQNDVTINRYGLGINYSF